MKRFLPILLCALFCASCGQNEPSNPSGGVTHRQTVIDFSYEITEMPFVVTFTNLSQNLINIQWDFGDSKTSVNFSPTHKYADFGTYIVTLTGYDSMTQKKLTKTASIKITKPKIYFAGLRFVKVPKYGYYYRFKVEDDDWPGSTWSVQSQYTPMLSSNDLPFTYRFTNPVLMDGLSGDNYYTVYVYWSNKSSNNGTQCLKQRMYTENILQYPGEITLTSDNKDTQVVVLFDYRN